MNILLTNDDGYLAEGILKLRKVLEKYGTVYMVSPYTVQSGKGTAIKSFMGVKIYKQDDFTLAVDGTPADCVQVALAYYNDVKFDLLVSGCNEGYNLSTDTMYSGTCGACIQGIFSNLKCIAFSCINKDSFNQIDKYTDMILNYIFDNKLLSNEYFLNVNYHNPTFEEPKGINITKLYFGHYNYSLLPNEDKFIINRNRIEQDFTLEDDIGSVNNGYISISPLTCNTFNSEVYLKVKSIVNK